MIPAPLSTQQMLVFCSDCTLTFLLAGTKVSGFYRVRAVDYWSKPGLFSIPVQYIEALA